MSHSRQTSINSLPVRDKPAENPTGESVIPESSQKLKDCPFPGCDRTGPHGFARTDHLNKHRSDVHGEDVGKKKSDKGVAKAETNMPPAKVSKKPKKIEGAEIKGIDVSRDTDFSAWYQQVLTKGNMIEYYDVPGCFVLKPGSWSIWEKVQRWFDDRIRELGVENCSFPLFVSEEVLNTEKDHIEGFAAEVAWVTHGGKTKLDKRIAIRPTSETVMYPYYAKWIRSHRDLPLRLNQWNSVVRWEFKHPMPFLRTREFHWQEGHTAFLTREEAEKEVLEILDLYARVYTDLLAVPVIKGRKTENEKFAGALFTTTVEGYIPATGRAIQGGTSHCLGQNFSKMFQISVEDPTAKDSSKQEPLYVWQNSWGLSTRVIGVMIMTHGDDRGLVVPPRVAKTQVIIVPVGITSKLTEEDRSVLYKEIEGLVDILKAAGLRAQADLREGYSPGWKFNDWELKGVPLRLEFGPGESKGHFVTTSRRDLPKEEGKGQVPIGDLATAIPALLETIQKDLYDRADAAYTAHRKTVTEWDDFVPALNNKDVCLIPHCLTPECEDEVKEQSARKAEEQLDVPQDEKAPSMGAKSLCIPFEQPGGIEKGVTKCLNPKCSRGAEAWCLFGRSY